MYQNIKKINSKITLISILIIQFLLCYYAFFDILTYPNKYIFNSIYDGLKNYYVLNSYVNGKNVGDFLQFTGYNYPFGENVFFIDNTPIFSIPYKFLVSNGIIDSSNLIYHYNLFLISCVFLSSLIAYKIVRKFTNNPIVLILTSISVPWICQQINRLSLGHFNLSISLYLLLCFLILINIYQKNKKQLPYFLELVYLYLLVLISSFTHFYYFPILLFLSSSFFILSIIQKFYLNSIDKFKYTFYTFITLIFSASTFYFSLNYYDLNATERLSSANGYNWIEWKLNIHALISPNVYNNIKFIFSSAKIVPMESHAFLGAGTLYLIFVTAILLAIKKQRIELVQFLKSKTEFNLVILLLLSTLICLLISIGPDYYFNNNEYYFTNYLNPFFYLIEYIPIIEQFRCLSRFSWSFILFMQLFIAVISSYFIDKNNILKYLTIVFLLFNFSNAMDTVKFYHQNYYTNPFYKGNVMKRLKK